MRQALKEWAVVVEALREGRQILLLRKGGIHEKGGAFRIAHEEFLLFPTYEHQKADLLQPEARRRYAAHLDPAREAGPVRIDLFARLADAIELADATLALRLAGHHLWTPSYVQARIDYKPENPLYLLLLKAFELPRPIEAQRHPRYAGCRSWLELEEDVATGGARPVLSEEEHARRVREVKALVG